MAMTEKRLAAAREVLDNIGRSAAFRGPKIGGCDFSEPSSEQRYSSKILVLNLGALTEFQLAQLVASFQLARWAY